MVMRYPQTDDPTLRYPMGGDLLRYQPEQPIDMEQEPQGLATNPYQQYTREGNAAGWAIQAFKRIYGRNPTQDELASVMPAYLGTDANITNVGAGDALVAQMHTMFENTPEKLYARQQEEWQRKAPERYGDVNEVFNTLVQRGATEDELAHFGKLLASGQVDPYELRSWVMSMPEYQQTEDKRFRQGLEGEIAGYDRSAFQRGKEDIISRFSQMGRPTSPALDVALTDLQAQLAERRGRFLSDLSAKQYQGNKEAALAGYKDTADRYGGRVDRGIESQYGAAKDILSRSREIQDYNQQAQDYYKALDRYGRDQDNWLDYLNTGINAVNAGANAFAAF